MKRLLSLLALVAFAFSSCDSSQTNQQTEATTDTAANITAAYVAHLEPLNSNITGMNASAQVKLIVTGDSLLVTIDARGVPPKIQHWQHFHGFTDGKDASCATSANDANGDGVIDVTETESVSGTTMVPFNENPEEMKIPSDTYPEAGSDSSYNYEIRIPLSKLKSAFAASFGDSALNLDKRVLYIHGVPKDASLPSTAASIGDIPAHVTLPIACGKIERVMQ